MSCSGTKATGAGGVQANFTAIPSMSLQHIMINIQTNWTHSKYTTRNEKHEHQQLKKLIYPPV